MQKGETRKYRLFSSKLHSSTKSHIQLVYVKSSSSIEIHSNFDALSSFSNSFCRIQLFPLSTFENFPRFSSKSLHIRTRVPNWVHRVHIAGNNWMIWTYWIISNKILDCICSLENSLLEIMQPLIIYDWTFFFNVFQAWSVKVLFFFWGIWTTCRDIRSDNMRDIWKIPKCSDLFLLPNVRII